MEKESPPVVRKSLVSWIISKNTWLQVVLVITAIFAVFANVFPLEMQRRIINNAINLRKFDLLVFYCGLYLIAVIAASMLKYLINILQNIIGQRTPAEAFSSRSTISRSKRCSGDRDALCLQMPRFGDDFGQFVKPLFGLAARKGACSAGPPI